MANIFSRVRQALSDWLAPVQSRGSQTGISSPDAFMDKWSYAFKDPMRTRRTMYEEVLQMDSTIEEVAAALDILADNAVHGEAGEAESCRDRHRHTSQH